MKKIISLGIFLALVAAISTFGVAAVNELTAPTIAKMDAEKKQAAFKEIFPDGVNFEIVDDNDELEKPMLEITRVKDANGELLGFIYQQQVNGFADRIVYVFGIDATGKFGEFIVLSSSETPGYGQRISLPEWTDYVRGHASSERLDTLTNATVTTAPIVNAMYLANEDFNSRMRNEGE